MDNRARPEAIPQATKDRPWAFARNAVNVIFDNAGNIQMPRPGSTLTYSGDCHSLFKTPFITLFSEGGSLKKLNSDNTATTLKSSIGDSKVYYAVVADTVYFANEITTGKIRNGVASEWGTERPPRQPDCTSISAGGMFAGRYRVAITWITDEESGSVASSIVDVQEGGGINLSNFPMPPDYVTSLAIYVSSINSENLYLYGEYSADTSQVEIGRLTNEGVLPTIPLETQFGFPPVPSETIVYHYGRIYYPKGKYLYYTLPHRYGLQKSNMYFPFDSEIQTIITHPNVLYIGTLNNQYEVRNIDGDGEPILKSLLNCGSVKGSECYDQDGDSAYLMSDRGFIKATEEGLSEMSYEQCAIPFFKKGTSTVNEYDGVKYLLFVGQDGSQNPLANTEYNTAELVRGSL
jgi:hypothetical protein